MSSRYEQLRAQAVASPAGMARGGQGLALLVRSGMQAWMQAWAKCTVAPPVPPAQPARGEAAMLPLAMHKEVAMILAAMVLYSRPEARV